MTLLWTHKGKLLITVCIFGSWSSRLFLRKANLSYLFQNFSFQKVMRSFHGTYPGISSTHKSIKILIKKLEWWDLWLTSLLWYSKLSVTGDTAKYLVWHSAEVVHFHYLTQSAHSDLDPSWSEKERRRLRRDLSEAFPRPLPSWPVPSYIHYICLSSRAGSTQLTKSSQSPYD